MNRRLIAALFLNLALAFGIASHPVYAAGTTGLLNDTGAGARVSITSAGGISAKAQARRHNPFLSSTRRGAT